MRRRGWIVLLVLTFVGVVSGVWALNRPIQNGQDTMGAALLHAVYGGL